MTFGQMVIQTLTKIFLDYAVVTIGLITVCALCRDFYNKYIKTNKKTDHIDLMDRWIQLQMWRKYGNRNVNRPRV